MTPDPTWRACLALWLALGAVPGLLLELASASPTPTVLWIFGAICAAACWLLHCEDWHQKHPRWQRDSEMKNWYGPRDLN